MDEYGRVASPGVVDDIKRYDDPLSAAGEAKLLGAGYKLIEDGDSSYDPVTQTRATDPSYNTSGATIIRTYAVADKSLEDAKAAKWASIREDARLAILTAYPSWFQDNVANAVYGSAVGDPMKAHIGNIIIQSNTCENDVDAAETVQAIRDVTPDWPTE